MVSKCTTHRCIVSLGPGCILALPYLSSEKVKINSFVIFGYSPQFLVKAGIFKDSKRQHVRWGNYPNVPRVYRIGEGLQQTCKILGSTTRDAYAVNMDCFRGLIEFC